MRIGACMEKGYVHVYTGNGKGKTTSSIGLMIRAIGAGKKVYFGQFMKEGEYSEIKIIKERFKEIKLEQYGQDGFIINRKANDKELLQVSNGFERAKEVLMSGEYDVVVLDEINVAHFLDLITDEDMFFLIDNKPKEVELILTGRYASKEVIERADLVSEIKEIKHYYNEGIAARTGFEL
jgi:cob(I)alamin adenosyltransferase